MLVGVPREEPDDGLKGKIGINRPAIRVVDQVNSENTVGKGTSFSFFGVFVKRSDANRLRVGVSQGNLYSNDGKIIKLRQFPYLVQSSGSHAKK